MFLSLWYQNLFILGLSPSGVITELILVIILCCLVIYILIQYDNIVNNHDPLKLVGHGTGSTLDWKIRVVAIRILPGQFFFLLTSKVTLGF